MDTDEDEVCYFPSLALNCAHSHITTTELRWTPSAGLTWHDDIREAQFACHGNAPAEDERVLPADLLHVASQQLQRDDQACRTEETFTGLVHVSHLFFL